MPSKTLLKDMTLVHVGFRPHDLGVMVIEPDGRAYRPEWRLVSDLQTSTDFCGLPEFWATDRHRVYFDKPAPSDTQIHASEKATMEKKMLHPAHGQITVFASDEIAALRARGWKLGH